MPDKPAHKPEPQDKKYEVVVVTTGPSSPPVEASGHSALNGVVEKAFKQLGITTPLDKFTYKTEAGQQVSLTTKVEEACTQKDCKIFVLPTKVQDA